MMRPQQQAWEPDAAQRDTALAAVVILAVMTCPAWAPALLWWLLLELT